MFAQLVFDWNDPSNDLLSVHWPNTNKTEKMEHLWQGSIRQVFQENGVQQTNNDSSKILISLPIQQALPAALELLLAEDRKIQALRAGLVAGVQEITAALWPHFSIQ